MPRYVPLMNWTEDSEDSEARAVRRVTASLLVFAAILVVATLLVASPRVGLALDYRATVRIGGAVVDAEVAHTSSERQRGLSFRDGLAPGTGMLFVYSGADYRTFWMKDMRFCIDIVWIEGGQVVGAVQNACPSPAGTPDSQLPRYTSPVPVRYALEVPAGWLARNGLGRGAPVTITWTGIALRIVNSGRTSNSVTSLYAYDNDLATSWRTNSSTPPSSAYVWFDLGATKSIGTIKWLFAQTGYADALTIQASNDGVTWATLATPGGAAAGTWQSLSTRVSARYVLFSFGNPNRDPQLGYLSEVRILS